MVSDTVSSPSPGCFSPFPHGTGSLSIAAEYLVLAHSHAGFPQDFSSPVVLKNTSRRVITPFAYRALTVYGPPFQGSSPREVIPTDRVTLPEHVSAQPPISCYAIATCGLTSVMPLTRPLRDTPTVKLRRFRLIPVRSPLLGESRNPRNQPPGVQPEGWNAES